MTINSIFKDFQTFATQINCVKMTPITYSEPAFKEKQIEGYTQITVNECDTRPKYKSEKITPEDYDKPLAFIEYHWDECILFYFE